MKLTLMMAIGLKSNQCKVVPSHVLDLPSRRHGHPYVADLVIKSPELRGG